MISFDPNKAAQAVSARVSPKQYGIELEHQVGRGALSPEQAAQVATVLGIELNAAHLKLLYGSRPEGGGNEAFPQRLRSPPAAASGGAVLNFRAAQGTTVKKLDAAEVSTRLAALPPGWSIEGDELVKKFSPKGFKKAVAFANEVGALAGIARHHPDITIGFGKAEVRMTTHDAGGLSAKDFDLAASIEKMLADTAAAAAANPPPPAAPKAPGAAPAAKAPPPVALSADERGALLSQLGPGWQIKGDELVKSVETKGFKSALKLLNDVAGIADQQRHHPDIAIGFGKAQIRTTTHDAGGLSERDVALAKAIDALLAGSASA